jgi:hypothetical protein
MESEQNHFSDLTDRQWPLVRQLLPPVNRLGRRPVDRRSVLNAILYVVRSGCQWRLLTRPALLARSLSLVRWSISSFPSLPRVKAKLDSRYTFRQASRPTRGQSSS